MEEKFYLNRNIINRNKKNEEMEEPKQEQTDNGSKEIKEWNNMCKMILQKEKASSRKEEEGGGIEYNKSRELRF